jgi:DNA-binding response OmpR family regulator
MKKPRILIVEDEKDVCEIVSYNLANEGFEVDEAYSAEEALTLKLEKYDLLLLDVMMGKISGFKLAEKIRKEKNLEVPIIFLTAKDTENDLLTGFSIGADDYISKPFSVKELIARIKALLKRTSTEKTEDKVVDFDNLKIDAASKKVTVGGNTLVLTKTEFDILFLLATNLDRVFSREDIMQRVWKDDVIVGERTVDVNIARIRKKLGSSGSIIKNRSGYGYCFEPDR